MEVDAVVPELEKGTYDVPRWVVQVAFGYLVVATVGMFLFAWNAGSDLAVIKSQLNNYGSRIESIDARFSNVTDKLDTRLRSLEQTRRRASKAEE
jgi:hypothetical protein